MAAGGGGIYSRRFGREELGQGLGEVKEVVGEAWARAIGEGEDVDGGFGAAVGTTRSFRGRVTGALAGATRRGRSWSDGAGGAFPSDGGCCCARGAGARALGGEERRHERGRLEKKGRRKQKWREERQQGYFGRYENGISRV